MEPPKENENSIPKEEIIPTKEEDLDPNRPITLPNTSKMEYRY